MSEWPRRDPVLRWLRALAILAILGLAVVVVVNGVIAQHPVDIPLVALLLGVASIWLGYEVFIPGISKPPRDDDDDD